MSRSSLGAALGLLLACALLALGLRSARAGFAEPVAAESAWQNELAAALTLARQQGKPLHVQFSRPGVPLAARMAETLASEPVAQLARLRFVNLRLDAGQHSLEFRRWLGGAGALGSCILDVSAAEPDVVAAQPGFAEPARYLEFLDGAASSLPKLQQLRTQAAGSSAAALSLAELYRAQGSLARARSLFGDVKQPLALRAQALERLARLDVEAGQIARARAELTEALALGNATSSERWMMTEALLLSGERRVGAAISLLTAGLPTLARAQEAGEALLLLGTLEHELGRNMDALAHLEQVAARLPGTALARTAEERTFHIAHPESGHTH